MKLNPWIEFDLVRSSSISERSIEYVGHKTISCIFFFWGGGGHFFRCRKLTPLELPVISSTYTVNFLLFLQRKTEISVLQK